MTKGIVAAGHPQTALAAEEMLRAGGNAFDAAAAAALAACVCEPVLASPGGGGFALCRPAIGAARLVDFFVQTPLQRAPVEALDFHPIDAEFGIATQAFHIGMGSIATPGLIKGIEVLHDRWGALPWKELLQPALQMARNGVVITPFQGYVMRIVRAILGATPGSRQVFCRDGASALPEPGVLMRYPALADVLEELSGEGARFFYEGEIARRVAQDCRSGGGLLGVDDFRRYQVEVREPLEARFHETRLLLNPAPALGGLLLGLGLQLLEDLPLNGRQHLQDAVALLETLSNTDQARLDAMLSAGQGWPGDAYPWDPTLLESYRDNVRHRLTASRGTTQITVGDAHGNVVSMTVSNGEGSGYVVPGCGIMMNNILGEDDIQPRGFHSWAPDSRVSSMMAPTLMQRGTKEILATGSGGSKRIRSALLQVLLNLLQYAMGVDQAVDYPRMHLQDGELNVEPGFPAALIDSLAERFSRLRMWDGPNMYFGGAHTIRIAQGGRHLEGRGDSRRAGVCVVVR